MPRRRYDDGDVSRLCLEGLCFLLVPAVNQPVIRIPTPRKVGVRPRHPEIVGLLLARVRRPSSPEESEQTSMAAFEAALRTDVAADPRDLLAGASPEGPRSHRPEASGVGCSIRRYSPRRLALKSTNDAPRCWPTPASMGLQHGLANERHWRPNQNGLMLPTPYGCDPLAHSRRPETPQQP
jgi:hypothetical protein